MQFVDQVDIIVKAGEGGNGIVAYRHEKLQPKGGPSGGNGGKGGSVIVRADAKLNTLVDLRYKKHYKAERGGNGGGNERHGKNGEDLILRAPVGTLVCDLNSGTCLADLTRDGQEYVAAKGGVISMTREMACWLAQYNIRVNCISPGGFWRKQDEAFVREFSYRVPMGRMGRDGKEVKGAVVFLASEASSYITGINLPIDGGMTAW